MKSYLYLLFCALLFSCTDKDEVEPDVPGIENIVGSYTGSLFHNVIKINETFDTTYTVNGVRPVVAFNDQEQIVTIQILNTGRYVLPELKYKVRKIENLEPMKIVDVYLELLNTNEYRMKAIPNQIDTPVFRIWPKNNLNRRDLLQFEIFLRSQDPDSVYNISVIGVKN
ncbi:hypothetical protein [Algoriphagus halophilus]|uniref:Uncharacterized protein n=1 Tax=Algoriphagus halophilus TaxID=226505 RepID=A0A1N6GIQ0_9BACT|nr:hypothetical protein [Algoriphagus halophilus]SIO07407.1 hypothetical protein SAMN05444394_3284 [Algoriphagus halophilus]